MAPEMYEEHYDEAVDVYAYGLCMLEMATSGRIGRQSPVFFPIGLAQNLDENSPNWRRYGNAKICSVMWSRSGIRCLFDSGIRDR